MVIKTLWDLIQARRTNLKAEKIEKFIEKLKSSRDGEISILFGKEYDITDAVSTIELPYATEHLLIDNALSGVSDIKVKINYNAPDSVYVDLPANSGLPIEGIKAGMHNFKAYCPNAGETSTIKVMGVRL